LPYAVSLGVSPTKGSAPLSVLVSGGVSVDGRPVAADVGVYRNGALIRTLRSSGLYGTFEMYDVLTAAGTYNYQAKAMGVASPVRTVTVTAPPPPPAKRVTVLTLVGSPLSGLPPITVTLWATLTAAGAAGVGGRKVSVYSDGKFMFSKVTDEGGKVTGSVSFTVAGTYNLIAEFEGDNLYERSSSNLVTVRVTAPPPPPPVEEWTHKLEVGFIRMPWATSAGVMAVFDSTIIPFINCFEWLVGYEFVGKEMNWDGLKVTLFYRARGSPVITAAILGAALLKIALVAIGLMIAAGFIIMALAWYEREKAVASREQTLEELVEQKVITPEQYAEWSEAAEKPWWEKYGGWLVLGLLGVLALRRGKKREEMKE